MGPRGERDSVTTDSVIQTRAQDAQPEALSVGEVSLAHDVNGNLTADEQVLQ